MGKNLYVNKVKSGHTRSCGCQAGRKGRYKYNSGDKVGPYNILLKHRIDNKIGVFECPECKQNFEATLQIIIAGDKKRCGKCHNK